MQLLGQYLSLFYARCASAGREPFQHTQKLQRSAATDFEDVAHVLWTRIERTCNIDRQRPERRAPSNSDAICGLQGTERYAIAQAISLTGVGKNHPANSESG